MHDRVTQPCQECGKVFDTFNLIIEREDEILLRIQCHDCRSTTYVHLSFEALNCIARGEPLKTITTNPNNVM